jgi:glycosyltransferase involved in cell wall biosynthesis
MRLLVFSEHLRAPFDEGIKKLAAHLAQGFQEHGHRVTLLTSGGARDEMRDVENVDANRLLLSARLRTVIRRFRPQAIVYVPTACGTVFSFLRARVLRFYGRGVPTVLIALQPRHYTVWGRWLISRLAPDWVLAQSRSTAEVLGRLGCSTSLLPPAVDVQRFRPALAKERAILRARYGVPPEATVVTHVGHLKDKRNLAHFLALQGSVHYHTVIVASTSTAQDTVLKATLQDAGTTVIDTYVTEIEDIYRLSDAYLFLAEEETAAIEVPLSVLEAMACNLPVICTPFGGLPDFFEAGDGLFFYGGEVDLRSLMEMALSASCATRAKVQALTWAAAAESVLRLLPHGGTP